MFTVVPLKLETIRLLWHFLLPINSKYE